jgi:hypothetical protein
VEQSLSSLPKKKPAVITPKDSPPQIVEEVVGLMAEIIIKSKRRFITYA